MTLDELVAWLDDHVDDIFLFTDYEVTRREDEAETEEVLGKYWFRKKDWNAPGYRFIHLGHDGTGGDVYGWLRPGAEGPVPIVFFGSEGGRGVLTATPERFAQALAHGVMFEEYPGFGSDGEPDPPSVLTEENWMLTADDPEEAAEAREALAHYREDAEARFGAMPPLDRLTAGLEDLNAEFIGWMEQVLG